MKVPDSMAAPSELEIEWPESLLKLIPEITLRFKEADEEVMRRSLAYESSLKENFNTRLSEEKAKLKERNYPYAELLDLTAMLMIKEELNDLQIQFKDSLIDRQKLKIEYFVMCAEHQLQVDETSIKADEAIELLRDAEDMLEAECNRYEQYEKRKKAADIWHGRLGGSREKHEKIRSLWASGKYSSRDICAEEECNALKMSFSSARKALRNTPKPT